MIRKIQRGKEIKAVGEFMESDEQRWQEIREMAAKYFPHQTIRITVEVCPPEKNANMKMIGYWYAELVKKVRFGLIEKGDYINIPQTEQWIHDHLKEITKEEVSYTILKRFISTVIVDRKAGTIKEVVPVLESLTDAEFSGLFDPIICWAAQELQIVIMYPNEFEE